MENNLQLLLPKGKQENDTNNYFQITYNSRIQTDNLCHFNLLPTLYNPKNTNIKPIEISEGNIHSFKLSQKIPSLKIAYHFYFEKETSAFVIFFNKLSEGIIKIK